MRAVNRIAASAAMTTSPSPADPRRLPAAAAGDGWQRFKAETIRLFHLYANWLVSISWKRFFVALGRCC